MGFSLSVKDTALLSHNLCCLLLTVGQCIFHHIYLRGLECGYLLAVKCEELTLQYVCLLVHRTYALYGVGLACDSYAESLCEGVVVGVVTVISIEPSSASLPAVMVMMLSVISAEKLPLFELML